MAFDKQNRNLLQRMVDSCRRLLSEEFTKQLQELYGIQPGTGNIIDLPEMVHLTDDQYAIASLLRDRIEHLASGLSVSSASPAIERLIREQAFTVLNRFAALRMCEEREIVKECVRKGMQSQGFQVYLQVAGTSLGDTYQRYKVFLYCLFDELAIDLGILFDRYSPFGLLFPREQALTELLNVINDPQLKDLWKEDETIGWVYQYFNTKEEREAMRKASQAPRNSRELAVRNQFFTPRYVVGFLTDNTLGRIWYEMTRGNTSLKDKCNYLVRRPNEIFLAEGEDSPLPSAKEIPSPIRGEGQGEGESNEDLLKQPVYIPHRPIKDPRRIAMLDPACGSMHFGLYAFELYEAIYEEAWDNYPELLTDIREQVADKEDFMKMVPEMIIRHNIHGIDIDPRACQIAGLSLWLRAQKSYQRLRLKPADRPVITKSNIVCAEPMPGEKEMLEEFIVKLRPPVLGDLVREVWNKMQLAGEAGSLLKIEEELKTAIEEAKKEWERIRSDDPLIQEVLFKELQRPVQQQMRFDVTGVKKEEFWDEAEALVLSALRDFAESATNGHGYQRKLFAEDAVQGFAFIDLCRKRFDVVLMNPPFGEFTIKAKEMAKVQFTAGNHEILAAFIERGCSLKLEKGLLGSITSRTPFFQTTTEEWRKKIVLPARVNLFVELGNGVLDSAMVGTVAYVLGQYAIEDKSIFIRPSNADFIVGELIHDPQLFMKDGVFVVRTMDFNLLAGSPFAYWLNPILYSCIKKLPNLEEAGIFVKVGLQTGDDFRFIKAHWEVNPMDIRSTRNCFGRWVTHAKGGENSPYISDIHLLVNWYGDGAEIHIHPSARLNMYSKTPNELYLIPGLTFSYRTFRFSPSILPEMCITGVAGMGIFSTKYDLCFLVSVLNSSIVNEFIAARLGRLDMEYLYQAGVISPTPFPDFHGIDMQEISEIGKQLYNLAKNSLTREETSRYFVGFDMTIADPKQYAHNLTGIVLDEAEKIMDLYKTIDNKVADAYGISITEIADLSESGIDLIRRCFPASTSLPHAILDNFVSWYFGCLFGRWDVRLLQHSGLLTKSIEPYDPLPLSAPAMLIGTDGLPATPGNIVSEEWLRARPDVNTLPPEGLVKQPTISDSEYPIKIAWDGILVDDPTNQNDIISHIREVLEVIWKDRADAIEQEACEILGVKSLRDYFRKPSGFFADHLKRYSKSRRQAPIYWPLSTASGSYTLWIYYHRLTDQMLYKCVNDFVNPKIEAVSRGIEKLQSNIVRGGNSKQKEELSEQMDFLQELKGFRDELLRVAQLPYKPNLNDGVLITASPLHNLFNLPKWKRDLTECWNKLESGEYDWAHLAYTIWPERVREVCKRDRSIAIAHGLEDICEVKPPEAKTKKRKPADKKSSEKEGRKKTGGDYALEKMGLDFE